MEGRFIFVEIVVHGHGMIFERGANQKKCPSKSALSWNFTSELPLDHTSYLLNFANGGCSIVKQTSLPIVVKEYGGRKPQNCQQWKRTVKISSGV